MVAPISVCLIVRDEHGQLENCLKSIRPHVAEIIVVDTGSEDNSVEIARKYADFVETYTECNDPTTRTPENPNGLILRFDQARNRAFSHAKQPWVMWVDGDDEVVGAENLSSLIEEYDRARNGQPSMVMMKYEYSRDHAGNVNMIHERERLVTPRSHFEWRGWVHEVLCPLGGDVRQHTDRVKIVHHRNAARKKIEPGRNLRILRKQYEVYGDKDARHLYYLGMECGNNGLIDEAIKWLTLYMDKSGWDDERWQSAQLIANHYMNRGDYEKAIEWGFKAILIREDWGEGYFTVAKGCYFMAQRGNNAHRWWQRCVHYARMGLEKPPTATTLFVNPLERSFEIHRYYNLALSKIGDTKGAIESIKTALKVFPHDEQLNLNKRIFEEYEAVEEYKRNLNRLVELGKITKEVRDFLETTQRENKIPAAQGPQSVQSAKMPDAYEREPQNESKPVNSPKASCPAGQLDIVFYVGRGVEAWNPKTAKLNGIGGSETAVIEMGRRLAARGHLVRVYGDCSPRNGGESLEGMFGGVQYLDVSKYKDISCDVLIVSRRPEAVDACYNVKWKHSVLWVHDVHCGDALNPQRAEKLDRILVLSDWHRQNILTKYTWLPPYKVQKTRNGIDLARFDQKQARNPHRIVYSSSPDRGLDALFDIWPRLRNRVPDAELHIYYGFQTWEAYADDAQRLTITHLKNTIEKFKHQGVFYHGRVPQDELAQEMLKSGVWAYPTWFSETSCQLAGSLVFTRNGMKPIENIRIGDMVLTHKGRFRPVTKLIQKRYDGLLYTMKRAKDSRPISITAEHPVYIGNFHVNDSSKGNRVYSRKNDWLCWKLPSKVVPNRDYLTSPKMEPGLRTKIFLSDYVDMPVLDGQICRNHNSPSCRPVRNEQVLDVDFMYILGLFAAEGCVSRSSKRQGKNPWFSSITFAFHKRETKLISKVLGFFGRGTIRSNSENGVSVILHSSPWANFLKNVIGTGREKKVPDFVWDTSLELQESFLRGMIDGSKSARPGRTGNGYQYSHYTSVSPSLAYGAAQILANLGKYPSVYYDANMDSFSLVWADNPKSKQFKIVDNVYCTRLQEVSSSHYSGMVYNFEVEEDESYVTDRTIVHNCISAMEAQAAGLRIVTTPVAALNETVGNRGTMVPGDWKDADFQNRFLDATVAALLKEGDADRLELQLYATEHFGWDDLAKDWENMFIGAVKDEIFLPEYQVVA